MPPQVNVTAKGAVLLGLEVSCDGFHRDYLARVQTHIHLDHMNRFETSKGNQNIFLSHETRELLIAERNADLSIRDNIIPLDFGDPYVLNSSRITIYPSNHMLGSVQVKVELDDGMSVGYSGDFSWPLEEVINVDQLVVDSTYGAPTSIREYSQIDAERALLEIVSDKISEGPLLIKSHRGTLHRSLEILSCLDDYPIVASARLCSEVGVYRMFGYPIGKVYSVESEEGAEALNDGRYIRFFGTGDQFPVQPPSGTTTITLSAYMTNPKEPVLEYSNRAMSIALSDHADYRGTIEYIRATGAQYVLTDNSRGGHAFELANALKSELGIEAVASDMDVTNEWGL